MYSRVIRHEILESDRWLDLPSDTHRLAYFGLLLQCDDFGNFKGGPRRVFRFLHRFTQIKNDADALKLMSDLMDTDLVRRYEADGAEFWHIPRFRNARRYTSRLWPKSPWCDAGELSTVEKKQSHTKESAADLPQICRSSAADLPRGVGVGDGVGVGVGVGDGGTLSPANAGDCPNQVSDPQPEKSAKSPPVPFQRIVDLYHELLPMLPRVAELNNVRRGLIRSRWADQLPDLDTWAKFFRFVGQSRFLTGQAAPSNGKPPFRADLEWLCRPTNFSKVIEEKYHGTVGR